MPCTRQSRIHHALLRDRRASASCPCGGSPGQVAGQSDPSSSNRIWTRPNPARPNSAPTISMLRWTAWRSEAAELPVELGSRHPDLIQLPDQHHPAVRVRGRLEPGGEEEAVEREVPLDPRVEEARRCHRGDPGSGTAAPAGSRASTHRSTSGIRDRDRRAGDGEPVPRHQVGRRRWRCPSPMSPRSLPLKRIPERLEMRRRRRSWRRAPSAASCTGSIRICTSAMPSASCVSREIAKRGWMIVPSTVCS